MMGVPMNKWALCLCGMAFGAMLFLESCAAERQGVVCDEIEYRLNTMTYSPDQRAFAEEELRVCREDEAKKKGEAAARRQSIYDRFAKKDSSQTKMKVAEDGSIVPDGEPEDVSVSKALKDSSGEQTTSIYDRYGAMKPAEKPAEEKPAEGTPADSTAATPAAPATAPAAEEAPVDTSAADVGSFQ